MTDTESDRLIEVNSWEDVPAFASETEEADFWASHSFGPGLTAEAEAGTLDFEDVLPPPRARTAPVSLRFDTSTISRLKALARRRNKGYQTLAKEFIAERLYEEEKREGIVGDSKAS